MQQTLEDIISSKHLFNLTELIQQQMHLFVEHPDDQEHFIYEVQEKCKNGGMRFCEVYASDDSQEKFIDDFINVWDKVMMADRFDVK